MDRREEKAKIQSEILNTIKQNGKCLLGQLVQDLGYTYNEILMNVMDLKQQGKIRKNVHDNGFFSLEEDNELQKENLVP